MNTTSAGRHLCLRELSVGEGVVEALPAITAIPDDSGDIIAPGGIRWSRWPKILWSHDLTRPVARVERVEELLPGDRRLPPDLLDAGAGALWIQARFDLADPDAAAAWRRLRHFPDMGWSIGFDIVDAEPLPDGGRLLRVIDVLEASPVAFGMHRAARTITVKTARADTPVRLTDEDVARVAAAVAAEIADRITAASADTSPPADSDATIDDADDQLEPDETADDTDPSGSGDAADTIWEVAADALLAAAGAD